MLDHSHHRPRPGRLRPTSGQLRVRIAKAHCRRARAEDRSRTARGTGLPNLPQHTTAQNHIWLEIVQLALDLLAWMPMLALTGDTRRWEIKKLRLRLFSTVARLVRSGRQHMLRFTYHWPGAHVLLAAYNRLALLPTPADSQKSPARTRRRTLGAVEPRDHPARQPGDQPAPTPKPTRKARNPRQHGITRTLTQDRG